MPVSVYASMHGDLLTVGQIVKSNFTITYIDNKSHPQKKCMITNYEI